MKTYKDFTVNYLGWHSWEPDFGDDQISFEVEIIPTFDPANKYKHPIAFMTIEKHLRIEDKTLYDYLQKIKQSHSKWGYCESKIVQELEEAEFDIKGMLLKYLNKYFPFYDEYLRDKQLRESPVKIKQNKKKVDDLGQLVASMRESTIKNRELCELLEAALTENILKIYPGILESDPKFILKLEDIVIKHVSEIANKISNLNYEIRHPNDKEKK